jgi:hypothetical protein
MGDVKAVVGVDSIVWMEVVGEFALNSREQDYAIVPMNFMFARHDASFLPHHIPALRGPP